MKNMGIIWKEKDKIIKWMDLMENKTVIIKHVLKMQ
jgi:hypothetical protein